MGIGTIEGDILATDGIATPLAQGKRIIAVRKAMKTEGPVRSTPGHGQQ